MEHIAASIAAMPTERAHRLAVAIELARLDSVIQGASGAPSETAQAEFQTRLGSAVEHGLAATNGDARDYRNWLSLGNAYHSVVALNVDGAYESAKNAYQRAAELNPIIPTVPYAQAQLEISRQQSGASRPFLESAISLKADFVPALVLLAQLELAEGNLPQAIERAEAASVFEPTNPLLQFQTGVLKFEQKDYAGARTAFDAALELAPDYSNARYYLGRTLFATADVPGAIAAFEEVLRLNPENTEVAAIIESLKTGDDPFAAPKE